MYIYICIYICRYFGETFKMLKKHTLLTLNNPSKPAVALLLSIRTSPAGDHVDFETMCSERKICKNGHSSFEKKHV